MSTPKTKYYKHPKWGNVYGEQVRTPLLRFAWPYLITAKEPLAPKEGEEPRKPRFEITGIMDPNDATGKDFFASLKVMKDEMLVIFNEGNKAKLSLDDDSLNIIGNEFDLEKYPYYKDMVLVIGRHATKPQTFGRKREELDASTILGGMKGVLLLTPIITAKGFSYQLNAVQLVEDDGFRIGGFSRDVKGQFVDWDEPPTHGTPPEDQVDATPTTGKDAALNLL